MTARLLIVGTGLIGASIGLALADPSGVVLADDDEDSLAVALARGAGRVWDGRERVEHVVLAVPPGAVAAALLRLQAGSIATTYSHVASAQSAVQAEVEALDVDAASLCGSHPMAGRERSGPEAATAELFTGRPWALCPSPSTSRAALAATRRLAVDCGAEPVELSAADHDAAVALVSHLPQVAASAVAAQLLAGRAGPVRLAGPGLQDTTRIAASDPALWVQVLTQNAAAVAPLVRGLADELATAADALESLAARAAAGPGAAQAAGADGAALAALAALADLLERGRRGRALVPVKRGERDAAFAPVAIAVTDRPGQLAGVLASAAQAGVNVEDVRLEHLAGRPRGVIELLVQAAAVPDARRALAAAGWDVVV